LLEGPETAVALHAQEVTRAQSCLWRVGDDIRKNPRFDNLLERIGHPMMVGV